MENSLLEICCFNLESALIASDSGADRVELCADPSGGGTTPPLGLIKAVRRKITIELYPIIRIRGGDFLFSEEEFEVMLHDIESCKSAGCDGVVIGMLLPDGRIDKLHSSMLVERAYPMGVTFHRAFDWTRNPFESLEDIIDIGCERILTSGQQPTAILGSALIKDLVKQAAGRILIMPGSGVRASNIADLRRQTGAHEFHSSARIHKKSGMHFIQHSMQEDQESVMADRHEIEQMLIQLSR
ncbi:MAG: copper homeostasis protein CutC [Bacteroidota bacterium]|nr:copper homeostasis protein CutC [Bacteroidota bacterium]MDP4250726.1 copper homeostasis protein CutC [Bacteroidota bacterium]